MQTARKPGHKKAMIYTIYMWAAIIFYTLTWGTLLAILLPFNWHGIFYRLITRAWARCIVFTSRVPVEIEGLEKIPPVPCVYMSNHQSYFDVICLIGYLPVPVRFVAKKVLTYIPVFGQLMWATGHVIIKREDQKQAFGKLDQAAEKIQTGTSVLVFPEGTRSPDHKLGPFKKGGFVLAVKAGVPIIPISITGTHPMMPKGSFRFTRTIVRIRIGDPVASMEYPLEQKEGLMKRLRKAIIDNFEPESEEAKANRDEKNNSNLQPGR
jgi:1-acyl-sn-glycerol-3-phosphate acyltransferase